MRNNDSYCGKTLLNHDQVFQKNKSLYKNETSQSAFSSLICNTSSVIRKHLKSPQSSNYTAKVVLKNIRLLHINSS